MFQNLLIVIPTRNRADYTVRAINSVLNQENCQVSVLVSDNSTDKREIERLSEFCEQITDNRLKYVKPPEPLPMTQHWDWAMRQAMENMAFSHIAYLSDRTLFLKGRLKSLENILQKYGDKVVSYTYDKISDRNLPAVLSQPLRTGKIFEVKSSLILKSYADVERIEAIPKMVNCVVPRSIIIAVKEKTGNYFSSVSPDYNFAFNCLDLVDSVLFYDKSMMLSYGEARSTGNNMLEGNFQKDSKDFIKNIDNKEVCFDTPIKTYLLVANAITHEYMHGKRQSNNNIFPDLNRNKYNLKLIYNVKSYQDKEMKSDMWSKLRADMKYKLHIYNLAAIIRRKMQGARVKIYNITNSSEPYLKIKTFQAVEQALEYADFHPRKETLTYSFIKERVGGFPSRGNVKVLQDTI